jgi:hypothetical protein
VGAIADGSPASAPKKAADKASPIKPAAAGQGSLF